MPLQINRKTTRPIRVGDVPVGGGAMVSVQSMTNTFTQDVEATVAQIKRLEAAGCEIIRCAVPDMEAARAVRSIKEKISIPLIADIHFDHKLAIASAEKGADGLRINPGNIGSEDKVRQVVQAAKDHGMVIRIGVNAGSLEKDLLKKYGAPTAEAMVESAVNHIDMVRSWDFHDIKVSIKASDVFKTIEAYRALSEKTDLPLHLGITEAGARYAGTVKSSLGIGLLLFDGIGDTIRVSLTGDPVTEVRVAYEILRSLKIRERGPEIISCPTCGRTEIDVLAIVDQVEKRLQNMTKPMKIAIMGCVVNGPGEAREADVGIAGGRGVGIVFRRGQVIRKVKEAELVEALLEEIGKDE
ncbi:4-hydroxy-3-methylbut-2-en-1-yl diphosphate synthase [Desulfatibacillum alkenivorans DSM 16219]|uniref:4-hydroxy-3-methylbut-2-en-1-yl diphosphate synthase (flavodoxin) n=1 Tax=Desulfatibacillum alkenivorans DSM 16219 TaxID=1121393 RepID=A0A1M6BQ33_9BACT|nr:flavodoxin-dependent (E)-4-hydroxy-3-methylbut-2-enyl-diphosphate synthase [Desulfatibacillum alkenivorans]SHI50816.1 4-hydroxy-3-methylbut-2-en-1-yl diphosphate synthase [Desulfatibacillum alkenivorans DSM 16219]